VTILMHGNVGPKAVKTYTAHDRFVAVLDVLGMNNWLKVSSPSEIADNLDIAFVACDQSSMGSVDGTTYGPLISTTHFSDTLFLWSPDDSWASFAAICKAAKMIVLTALGAGVPLRGAISQGATVCNAQDLRFVGPSIADAYHWSERQRPYKSVGVDITPTTINWLIDKLTSDPLPKCFAAELGGGALPAILSHDQESARDLIWYLNCLFINHWSHGLFVSRSPADMFGARGLPTDDAVNEKLSAMMNFFAFSKDAQSRFWDREMATRRRQLQLGMAVGTDSDFADSVACANAYLALDQIRKERS
jgi:hypothetical protein